MKNNFAMQHFSRKLLTEWRKINLPFSGETIIIAVSGGADSVSLAFALSDLHKRKKILNKFIIAHFNHDLRGGESRSDAEFVEDFAKDLGFDFLTRTARKNEISKNKDLEQSARIARYKFLFEIAKSNNAFAVLTAHTINDQAETFLLNLTRGSGIEGLSAMHQVRNLRQNNEIKLIRPLLNWAMREDTEKFADINKIKYKNDFMNKDCEYKRVKIRKELIPLLKNYNPRIIETLANSAKLLRNDNELIEELIAKDSAFEELINSESIKISKVKTLSYPMLYKIIRKWLMKKRGHLRSLDLTHFNSIVNLIYSQKSGKIVELPNFEMIVKEKGELIFQVIEVEK